MRSYPFGGPIEKAALSTIKGDMKADAREGRVQAFKTKAFARFAACEGLEDAVLCEAVRRA